MIIPRNHVTTEPTVVFWPRRKLSGSRVIEHFNLRGSTMGNPAGVRRKQRLKRRKRYEQRLGPGAYLPKALREKWQQEHKSDPTPPGQAPGAK